MTFYVRENLSLLKILNSKLSIYLIYKNFLEFNQLIETYCFILVISAGNKHYKTANLQKIRRHYEQDTLRQQIMPDETNRFRYLYQVRRANGDALSSVS